MNYKRIYDALVAKAINRNIDGYAEVHHIIPKCIGGTNEHSNLVKLTAREHYVAHQLLCKIYPENTNLIFAVHMMTVNAPFQNRSNRLYEWVRKRHAESISKKLTGKIVSKETKQKMSIAAKKRGNNGWQDRKHSAESRQKMSASKKISTRGAGNSNASDWKIQLPNGDIAIIRSLKTFCKDNNLSVNKMRYNKYSDYKVLEKL